MSSPAEALDFQGINFACCLAEEAHKGLFIEAQKHLVHILPRNDGLDRSSMRKPFAIVSLNILARPGTVFLGEVPPLLEK